MLAFARGTLPEGDFRILFEVYYPRLLRFFSLKTDCLPQDAEDLTQEVFRRVYSQQGKLTDLEVENGFDRWLFTVASRVFSNWNRDRNAVRRRHVEESLDRDPEPSHLLGQVLLSEQSPENSPFTYAVAREQVEAVSRALRELPPRMRSCWVHYYVHERSVKDIARIMGIEANTVKSQLHQGRERLRAALQSLFDAPPFEDREP